MLLVEPQFQGVRYLDRWDLDDFALKRYGTFSVPFQLITMLERNTLETELAMSSIQ